MPAGIRGGVAGVLLGTMIFWTPVAHVCAQSLFVEGVAVRFEAEDFDTRSDGAQNTRWVVVPDEAAPDGSFARASGACAPDRVARFLQALPERGDVYDTGDVFARAPVVSYVIRVSTAERYRIWVRAASRGREGASFYLRIREIHREEWWHFAAVATDGDFTDAWQGSGEFGQERSGTPRRSDDMTAALDAGVYHLDVAPREDGEAIDAILLDATGKFNGKDDLADSVSCTERDGFRDCNSNGVHDRLDVVSGFSPDCNDNATPDECEGIHKLRAEDLPAFDPQLGESLAIQGDTVILGAPTSGGETAGAAYVYRHRAGRWEQVAKLAASDSHPIDFFGSAVALDGDVALVGARLENAVYIFRHRGGEWIEELKIAPDGASELGRSVAVAGETVVLGAPGTSGSGAVYVYGYLTTQQQWTLVEELSPSDTHDEQDFGYSAAMDDDQIIAGAPRDQTVAPDAGAAYVFRWSGSGWIEDAKLTANDGQEGDFLGVALAIDGDYAVVGTAAEAVYVFQRIGRQWLQQAKLRASDGAQGDAFGGRDFLPGVGHTVSIHRDTILVGAPRHAPTRSGTGAAYLFRRRGATWIEEAKLTAIDLHEIALFGHCVAIDATAVVVGAPAQDDRIGAAYVYAMPSPDRDGDRTPDECQVLNLTQVVSYDTIPEAVDMADDSDHLLADAPRFEEVALIDLDRKALRLSSRRHIAQPQEGVLVLADGALLESAASSDVTLNGTLRVPPGDQADVVTRTLTLGSSGNVEVRVASILTIVASAGVSLRGDVEIDPSAVLASRGPLDTSGDIHVRQGRLDVEGEWTQSGAMTIRDGAVSAASLRNRARLELLSGQVLADEIVNETPDGRIFGLGDLFGDLRNDAEVEFVSDSRILGDYLNNGRTTIVDGTLLVTGSLTNNGVLTGATSPPGGGGGVADDDESSVGLTVIGANRVGVEASLLLPATDWTLRLGGDFDVAIDDPARFDLSHAELRLAGLAGTVQTLEVLARDRGACVELDEQPFAIDRLHIGPTGSTVELVDRQANDPSPDVGPEALYVRTLEVDAGSVLDPSGLRVYCESLANQGTITEPGNVVVVGDGCSIPFLRGDANGDGGLDVSDSISVLLFLTGRAQSECERAADVDDSGQVDVTDAIRLVGTLFRAGAPPEPPFPDCGEDPSADELGCESYSFCR